MLGLGIGQVGLGAEGGEGRSVVDMGEGSGGDGVCGSEETWRVWEGLWSRSKLHQWGSRACRFLGIYHRVICSGLGRGGSCEHSWDGWSLAHRSGSGVGCWEGNQW